MQKGLQQVAQAGGNTLAFAEDIAMAPFELTSGLKLGELSDNAPFNRWAQKIREEGNAVNEYYAENIKAGGKGAEIFDRFGSSLIAAVPQAAAAVLSGGTSAIASTAGLQAQAASALSPGLTSTEAFRRKSLRNCGDWTTFGGKLTYRTRTMHILRKIWKMDILKLILMKKSCNKILDWLRGGVSLMLVGTRYSQPAERKLRLMV